MSDVFYAVGFSGLSASASAGSRARRKSEEPADDDAEAPAVAAAAARDRARRRRRSAATAKDRAHRYEFMDSDGATTPSEWGTGALGFVGATARSGVAEAAGLTTLTGRGLSDGPTLPMLPSSWGDELRRGSAAG
jgi:PPE-PPW subfamily C-terminal region